jgi:hypothetical protein
MKKTIICVLLLLSLIFIFGCTSFNGLNQNLVKVETTTSSNGYHLADDVYGIGSGDKLAALTCAQISQNYSESYNLNNDLTVDSWDYSGDFVICYLKKSEEYKKSEGLQKHYDEPIGQNGEYLDYSEEYEAGMLRVGSLFEKNTVNIQVIGEEDGAMVLEMSFVNSEYSCHKKFYVKDGIGIKEDAYPDNLPECRHYLKIG